MATDRSPLVYCTSCARAVYWEARGARKSCAGCSRGMLSNGSFSRTYVAVYNVSLSTGGQFCQTCAKAKNKAKAPAARPYIDVVSRACGMCRTKKAVEDMTYRQWKQYTLGCRQFRARLSKSAVSPGYAKCRSMCLGCRKAARGAALEGARKNRAKLCSVCGERTKSHGYKNNFRKSATHCRECALEDMVNLTAYKCMAPGCTKGGPLYNIDDDRRRRGMYCSSCATASMAPKTKGPRWSYKMCATCKKRQASFNFPPVRPGGKSETCRAWAKPVACRGCKEDGMVNVRQKLCTVCCRKQACGYLYHEKHDRNRVKYCIKCLAAVCPRSAEEHRQRARFKARVKRGDPDPERRLTKRRKLSVYEVYFGGDGDDGEMGELNLAGL